MAPPPPSIVDQRSMDDPGADLFASEEDLEDVKNYSSLLKQIGKLDEGQEPGRVRMKLTTPARKNLFCHLSLSNRSQNKINLCIRDHEVAANVATGKPGRDADQVIIANHENVIFAINPVSDLHGNRAPINDDSPLKVFISEVSAENCEYVAGEDPVDHLFKRYRRIASYEGGPKPKRPGVPFAEHLSILVVLLRHCIAATTTDGLKHARRLLRSYVMAVSCHKMLRRANLGKGARGYFDAMSILSTDIPKPVCYDKTTIPDEPVFSQPPDKRQCKHYETFAKGVGQPEWARKVRTSPVYDVKGRYRLQTVLSYHLRAAVKALQDLTNKLPNNAINKIANFTPADQARAMHLINDACKKVEMLNKFIKTFHYILKHHIGWLGSVRSKLSTRQDDDLSPPKADEVEKSVEAQDDADDEDQDEDDGDELDQIVDKLSRLKKSPAGFGEAGMKYLKLICLHESSIINETDWVPERTLPPGRQRANNLMTDSTFVVVDIQQAKRDTKRTKHINTCLDELIQADPSLDKTILQDVLGEGGWNAGVLTRDSFGGTMHCEFIFVTLMMLAETMGEHLTMQWLNRNGIFAANTGLVKRFRNMVPGIDKSKRNCPICYDLCCMAAEMKLLKGSTEMVVPGYHTSHNEVAIPPFTLARVARKIVANLKQTAIKALHNLMLQQEQAVLWSSSVGSHPDSGNPDGVDLSDDDLTYGDPIEDDSYEGLGSDPDSPWSPDDTETDIPSSPPVLRDAPDLGMPPGYRPGSSPVRTRKATEERDAAAEAAREASRLKLDTSAGLDASEKKEDVEKQGVIEEEGVVGEESNFQHEMSE